MVDREVAGPGLIVIAGRRAALLHDAQRAAAEVPLDLGRRRSWRSWSGCSPRSGSRSTSANFSSYNKTYGSLAGVIVTLLFLWITNLALLFGGELDAELERGRQLQAGIAAEEELQLPARDTRNIKKARKKRDKDVALGRQIRRQAAANGASDREHELPGGERNE